MKQVFFTLFILSAIALSSCRKNGGDLNIKQYDQQQITNYISSNGLTDMVRDTSGGDTTGIYYHLINPGNKNEPALDYPDSVSFVYTLKTFDGKFIASDTILNHYGGLVGHITPNGLMLAVKNILKYRGASARILVPSHIAFGLAGAGSGSKTITNGRIAGNQCLDYYVHVIDNQFVYDDLVISNYITRNKLLGYTKDPDIGYYYKVTVPGTGINAITENSTITATYTGLLLNGQFFDNSFATTTTSFNVPDFAVLGLADALKKHATSGTSISVIIPSKWAYGGPGNSTVIPAYSCLRFDYGITAVSP